MRETSALAGLLVFAVTTAAAADVGGWRGDGTGHFPVAEPPADWEDAARVVWRTPTPGWSNASPVVCGDRVFLCVEPDTLMAVDRATGTVLWQRSNAYADLVPEAQRAAVVERSAEAERLQRELRDANRQLRQARRQAGREPDAAAQARLAELEANEQRLREQLAPFEDVRMPATHAVNGYSSPTPVSDGTLVYAFFGTGVAVAFDRDGNRRWARVIEKPTDAWGHSASPVLAAGRFIVHVRNVHALDAATGEPAWTAPSRARWGSSVVTEIEGQPVVITANGEIIRARDGRVLASGLHGLDYNAPVVHDGVIYFIEHGGKAFRLPSRADGSERPQELWRTEPPRDRYYASPVVHEGRIYAVHQRGVLSVIDAATGAVERTESLGNLRRTVYPSISLAGPWLVLGAESGTVVILDPADNLREVATARIDAFRSTPVFHGRRAYVRTQDALVCLERAP